MRRQSTVTGHVPGLVHQNTLSASKAHVMAHMRRLSNLDQDEVTAYKKQKIQKELKDRRLLEEVLSGPPEYRTQTEQSKLIEILLTFPAFQMVAENDYSEFIALSKTLKVQKFDINQTVFQ